MKKTIGIFSTKQGHQSISEAIKQKLEKEAGDRYEVKIFYTKLILEAVYESLYRLAPSTLKLPYELTAKMIEKDAELGKLILNIFLQSTYQASLDFVEKNKIDLAINCYFPFVPSLEKIQKKDSIPFVNIITDPRTFHPWQIAKDARVNLFFDNKNIDKYQKQCEAKASGWFVGENFEKDYQKDQVKNKLKIKEKLTFLISSGSEGSAAVLKILPALINCPRPLRIFVACGNNQSLYNNVLGIKKSLKMFSQSKAKITPIGYTKNMHLYMQAADLVIGKAGPNTLFETVATLTPFFAITYIAQEKGNLAIIKEQQLGYVEDKAKAANKKILDIISHPEQLEKFQENLLALKKYNQKSASILIDEIDHIFHSKNNSKN